MMICSTARTTGSEIMTLCLTLITVFQLLLAISGSITPVLHYVTRYYFHYVQPYNHNEAECPETFHSDDHVTFTEALLFIFTPYIPLIVPVKHRYVAKSSVREKFPDIPYASNVAFHIHSSASVQHVIF